MKAKPKDSTMLLRLGLMCLLLGIVASAISPYSPAQLLPAFLGMGMFLVGLGFGCIIFSVRFSKLEKESPPPPPPP
jgi:1,4-dihydroxy-2-naphthoate octaprenyltransferase